MGGVGVERGGGKRGRPRATRRRACAGRDNAPLRAVWLPWRLRVLAVGGPVWGVGGWIGVAKARLR